LEKLSGNQNLVASGLPKYAEEKWKNQIATEALGRLRFDSQTFLPPWVIG
jgi:hypothetical protein